MITFSNIKIKIDKLYAAVEAKQLPSIVDGKVVFVSPDDPILIVSSLDIAKYVRCKFQKYASNLQQVIKYPRLIKNITPEVRTEVLQKLEQINARVFHSGDSQVSIRENAVEVTKAQDEIRIAMNALVSASEINHASRMKLIDSTVERLGFLGSMLQEKASESSTLISSVVKHYLKGGHTVQEAGETVDAIIAALDDLEDEVKDISISLQSSVSTLSMAKDDGILDAALKTSIKKQIDTLYEAFSSLSSSLIFAAEELRPVLASLYFSAEGKVTDQERRGHFSDAVEAISSLNQIKALSLRLIQALDDEKISETILILNFQRLIIWINDFNVLQNGFSGKFENAIVLLVKKMDAFTKQVQQNPEGDLGKRKIVAKSYQTMMLQLLFSQENLDKVFDRTIISEVETLIQTFKTHPRVFKYFAGAFEKPLTFDADFWLLKNLKVLSLQEMATVHNVLHSYESGINDLFNTIRRKSKPDEDNFCEKTPLIALGQLEEQLFS